MENVCPSCGKLIKRGCQAFDLTRFMGRQLITYMDIKLADMDDDQKDKLIEGMKTLFNEAERRVRTRLIYTEYVLLGGMTEVENSEITRLKTCLFAFPYPRVGDILKDTLDYIKNDSSAKGAYDWYNNNESLIQGIVSKLYYSCNHDGDVRIDSIFDDYDKSSVVSIRVCPDCGEPLSYWAGRYHEISIGVLGSARISKTATLCAMASKFRQRHNGIYWQIWADKREKAYRFEEDCLKIYKEGRPIPPTEDIEGGNSNVSRLSYKVNLDGVEGYEGEDVILTFVDLPGEDLNDPDAMEKHRPYYENVDCIWYLTDIAELEQKIPPENDLGRGAGIPQRDQDKLLADMTEAKKYIHNREEPPLVAYILGKTDSTLISHNDKIQYGLFVKNTSGDPDIPLDAEAFPQKLYDVKDYMMKKNAILVNNFNKIFSKRGFFAMSAYGFDPKKKEKDGVPATSPEPYGCTAPFLWMLACMGYIKVSVNYTVSEGFVLKKTVAKSETGFLNKLSSNIRKDVMANLLMQNDSPMNYNY